MIHFAATFNKKADKMLKGRKEQREKLAQAFANEEAPIAWFHCASLGEFEQGRPIIEGFRNDFPSYKILITFFSPSGFEVQKNNPIAVNYRCQGDLR